MIELSGSQVRFGGEIGRSPYILTITLNEPSKNQDNRCGDKHGCLCGFDRMGSD